MKNSSFKLITTLIMVFSLSSFLHAQVNSRLSATASDPGFNRSVEKLEFSKDRKGNDVLKMNIGLEVNDKSNKRLNMNFDIVIYKNGKRIKSIQQSVTKDSAVTCAVTCKGSCPSIFGDGYCNSCGCIYNNWLSETLGETYGGDVFEVKLVPARKGLKDRDARDNQKRISYVRKPSRRK